jgi:hypothetical protein
MGWRLTTLFGNTAVMPIAAPNRKRTLMPLLTVVFLASYGLMTMLIVEQGNAIQQQHNLILVLMGDSRELWAMKGKILTDRSAQAQAQAESHVQAPSTPSPLTHGQVPSVQPPSTQTPSTQTPSTQAPSNQVPQRHSQSRTGKGAKPNTQVPPMPASDLSDQRRVLITL